MRILILIFLIALAWSGHAQIKQPAQWNYHAEKTDVTIGEEITLIFNVTLDNTWHLYSTEFPCEDGPMKTEFSFAPHDSYTLVGKIQPIGAVDHYDDIFECDVKYFDQTAQFKQTVKVLKQPLQIAGTYDYQVCTETTGQCIPGDGQFSFTGWVFSGSGAEEEAVVKPKDTQPEQTASDVIDRRHETSSVTPEETPQDDGSSKPEEIDHVKAGAIEGPVLGDIGKEDERQKSLWGFFILSFLAGLAALLTPCVFPMIPMTVSFFTGRGTKAQAIFYGASIIVIYTLAGALLAPAMGPETANHLSTEWLPNIVFFLVFIIFGLSFLGLFEITLPSSFINKVDKQADKGGWGGVFFMAFTLVLVSFSCTGPIVGSILVSSAGGEVIKPIVGMLGFSAAFAIPFTLFAIFPGWLKSMPKSGGWLNTIKVVLGFLEIGFAFKFLSIADQAFHWRILDREVNIAIWIVITALIGIYLMKGFIMPGDAEDDKRVSVGRVSVAIIIFSFTVYMLPGMWGAPLKALAGYLPPMYTHDFAIAAGQIEEKGNLCDVPKYESFLHLPHGIKGYFDYKQALACAREQNKPLFIDFTGHGCTNCREMEARVWSDPQVLQRLKNDYVVVALYVDDKTVLPEKKWYTSDYDNKTKKTIGKQNADLQIRRLNNNAQPFYILVGKDEHVLVPPKTYDLSAASFARFLDAGKRKYKDLYP